MRKNLKICALEAYYGGSHKAFLDTWIDGSSHEWTLLTLPARKWKWRMMHSAITFADEVKKLAAETDVSWDLIFCSDMLDLAKFKGLLPPALAGIPTLAYYHENQLTYPRDYPKSEDRHFALSNITTALAANAVWYNSDFHRREFLDACAVFAKKAPDYQLTHCAAAIQAKSTVVPQGVKAFAKRTGDRKPGPVRILWAHRWEYDKAPETFFKAMRLLRKKKNCRFRISVLGGHPGRSDTIFADAREEFSDLIDQWGYLDSYDEYCRVLRDIDIAVSTSNHEFFGISIAEAVSAGAFPVVPRRLAYPEILAEDARDAGKLSFFYEGSHTKLAGHLAEVIQAIRRDNSPWQGDKDRGLRKIQAFRWPTLIPALDKQVGTLCHSGQSSDLLLSHL